MKKELTYIPLFGWAQYFYGMIPVDRSAGGAAMKNLLKEAKIRLAAKRPIMIFPEGTRNKTADTFLPFHDGSFKIAEKSGAPIIPMTIVNSAAVFEDHFPKIKQATEVIEYGKPIYLNEMSREEKKVIGATVKAVIEETYFRNKEKYFGEAK